jgi:predicted RNase H-like HicB family nuclease
VVVAPPRLPGGMSREKVSRLAAAMKAAAQSAVVAFRASRGSEGPGAAARLTLQVQVEPDTLDGGFVAECLDFPGCVSEGATEHEALENLIEAITGVLEVRMQRELDRVSPGSFKTGPGTSSHRLELSVS